MATKTYDSIPARDVAFLGLGVMGDPMAGHLVGAGHSVTVYNRTPAQSVAWVAEYGHAFAATPKLAVPGAHEVARHRVAHHAQAQEGNAPRHDRFVGHDHGIL